MPNLSFTLAARRLYDRGQVENLRYDAKRRAIVLYDQALIEDDADGCGWPYDQDIVGRSVRIRKVLTVARPSARAASLLIYHTIGESWKTEPHESRVNITLNDQLMDATLSVGWNAIEVDPACLVAGDNEILVAGADASSPLTIPIADMDSIVDNAPGRRDVPQKSFRSEDGGRTWSEKLGARGAAGEYMIRLHLEQYVRSGTYVSPVMDLADVEEREAVKPPLVVRSCRAAPEHESPGEASLSCFIRTGGTPLFQEEEWDGWHQVCAGRPYTPRGRFFQVRLLLETADPLVSPVFQGLTVEAEIEPSSVVAAADLSVEERHVRPVIRSSIPFEYESLDHPSLRELREKYGLDEVVRGASDQFDAIVRLNHWVSQQWKWHPPDPYPEWDALQILEKQPNGESRGGFCGHYAIVLVQCCLAMGIQARFVFGSFPGVISGHEVTEVWSDDHGKWVLMDPNMDRHYLDRDSAVPLNALDLHRALLAHFFEGRRLGDADRNKERFESVSFEEFLARGPIICHGGTEAGPDWFDGQQAHLMWGHPSMLPRNDFFARPRPIPKAHGMGLPWSWNGYRHWYDPQTPRQPRFAPYTDRGCDWYWSLNQVGFALEQTAQQGVLRVSMDTFTPGLETFLVSVDEGGWNPSPAQFIWRLTAGANLLRMKVRNRRGVEGATSSVRVRYRGD